MSGLLRRCRTRIDPERLSLGPYLRRPMRVGRAVSQEELSEAAGITRQWYGMLEADRAIRVSAAALSRIADALMMDPVERAALFRLAVPELRSTSLTDRSRAVLAAFGSFRHVTRRLWAATTEAEALTLVREYGMTQFAPDEMVTYTRVGESRWDRATTGDLDADDRGKQFFALIRERWGPAVIDDLQCYTLLAQPGELMTRAEIDARFPNVAATAREALDAVGWADMSFAMANIRPQRASAARILALHATAHAFSDLERAQLSTLADLTSLALTGFVSENPGGKKAPGPQLGA
ncbi:MAG TPA: helix-turn-helix transcriptional regulator [Candidatus Acidoferrum sp.]|nr:helix-turn-helix transcriptional regulator [Candidatus Acidoferrum sp.]